MTDTLALVVHRTQGGQPAAAHISASGCTSLLSLLLIPLLPLLLLVLLLLFVVLELLVSLRLGQQLSLSLPTLCSR